MKVVCENCDWRGQDDDMAEAINPFDGYTKIHGCPDCASINSGVVACDADGCWRETTCGQPTADGTDYTRTCSKHWPRNY